MPLILHFAHPTAGSGCESKAGTPAPSILRRRAEARPFHLPSCAPNKTFCSRLDGESFHLRKGEREKKEFKY